MYNYFQNHPIYRTESTLLAITVTITLLAGFVTVPCAYPQTPPTIETIVAPQTIERGVSAKLWVEGVTTPGSILWVRATITRPDGQNLSQNFLGGVSTGAYEVDYDGFFDPGQYQVSIVAKDNNQNLTEPATTTVTQLSTEFQNDKFEPDNTAANATWFGINVGLHAHTFSDATDEDWVLIYAEDFKAGQAFDQKPHNNEVEIETRNLAAGVDTKIEVYKVDPLDPVNSLQLIAENDDRSEQDASSHVLFYVHLERNEEEQVALDGSGFYAIRVINMSPSIVGAGSHYDIRVWREQGAILAGGIAGAVTNKLTGQPIAKANVEMPTFGGIEALTTDDGIFVFPAMVPDFEYALEAWGDDYKRSAPITVTVRGGEFVEVNFTLDPDELQVPEEPSLAEIAMALLGNLVNFDSSDDGQLSLAEAQIALPEMSSQQFDDMDTDGNALLSAGELDAAANPKVLGCHGGHAHRSGPAPYGDLSIIALTIALLCFSARTRRNPRATAR